MSRQRSLIFWPVPLRKDREHSWKHHCRNGLMRELLGWIDVMAARRETETGYRFVFAKRKTLLTKCFKGKKTEGKHYSIRKLDAALAELREQHIISQYFETADGCGFVVAPHDSLCRNDSKTCLLPNRSAWQFVGQKPDWRKRALDALKTAALGQSKRQHNGSQDGSITAVKTAAVPVIDGIQNGIHNGSGQSLYDANFALLTEAEKADWLANGLQLGASTRSTRLVESPDEPRKPSYPSQDQLQRHEEFLKKYAAKQQEQHQEPKQERQAAANSLGDRTDEERQQLQPQKQRPCAAQDAGNTIGVHFANCTDIIDRLTDGELDQDDYHCVDEFADWTLLSECARAAVDAKKDHPYLGLQTNALLMRDVMKCLKKKHDLNAPEPWLPIMDAMQGRTSEQKAEKKRKRAEADAAKPVFSDKELEKLREEALRDRAPCQEKNLLTGATCVIFRLPEERIKMGFTVLGVCTVTGADSQGQNGKAVWHKARE